MKQKRKNLIIIIFPYLFIDELEGLEINKLHIRPSYTDNLDREKPNVKEHLINIYKLFSTHDNRVITHWSYIVKYLGSEKAWNRLKTELNKFANIVRFSQLCDLNEIAEFGHFNYFIFEITEDQEQLAKKNFIYYRGLLNGESAFHFSFKNGKVKRPYKSSYDLNAFIMKRYQIVENAYFKNFYGYSRYLLKNDEEKKFIRAIEWFNRSFSHYGRGVDQCEAILNAHTALETLLRPEDEDRNVRAQIKTALLNLLGHSKELSSWFDKFWQLRNAIVHGDVKPPTFEYIHPQSKSQIGHRRHLNVALKIFVLCLNSILKIRSEHPLISLEGELTSNEVRINQAIKLLKKKRKKKKIITLYQDKTFDLISSLRKNDISIRKKKIKEFGNLFLPVVKNELQQIKEQTQFKDESIKIINQILDWKGKEYHKLGFLYEELRKNYGGIYFQFKEEIDLIHILALRTAAYHYIEFATLRLLSFYN